MTAPLLELRSVSRTYRAAVPVHAVREVSLTVHRHDYLSIMGPSGSGKSTLLALLGVLDRPDAGAVFVAGADVGEAGDRVRSRLRARSIGFVFQDFYLVAYLDALRNVELALRYRHLPLRRRRALAYAALERVGLATRADHLPGELSGGERQRVAIARAIVGEPAVILADEPTGNLDTATSAEVLTLLESLVAHGTALVIVTHDPHVGARADLPLWMQDGRLGDRLDARRGDEPTEPCAVRP